jgi:hypothetical protein
MSTKKNAPPKKTQQGTRRNTRNRSNGSKENNRVKPPYEEEMPEELKKMISREIKQPGGVAAVIERLKANQTRQGQQDVKVPDRGGSLGVIEANFINIGHSLELQADRIRSIKARLTDLGFYDGGGKLNEKQETIPTVSEQISFTGKADVVDKTLSRHNDDLVKIIEHIDYLFSPSH